MVNALDTPVGKKAKAIENSIVRELTRIFKDDIQSKFGILTLSEIRMKIGNKVHDIIRSKVEQGYSLGSVGVANFLKEPNPKTSREDFANIEVFTEDLENQFWSTMEELGRRDISFEVKPPDNELHEMTSFDIAAAIISVSSFMAFYAVNNGIASKTVQLKESIVNLSEVQIIQRFGRGALIKMQDRKFSEPGKFPIKFVYLTANDGRVDPQFCAPLNRKEFDLDDTAIPVPPLHRHCRCIIVPKNTLTNEFLI